MDTLRVVILIVVAIAWLALWLGAFTSVVRHAAGARLAVWAVIVFVFPLVGSLAWFVVGLPAERRPLQPRT
jgi:hypothetical protein